MTVVAGVDFGTQSVRVSIVDSVRGVIGHGVSEYPVKRDRNDPDCATQSHHEHMRALAEAMHSALHDAGVPGNVVRAMALDTTGSTVIPVGEGLEPLDDYYLWCDHRAKDEAARITAVAHARKLPAIDWCGGVYSSEWGFAKLLHWLRHNPDKRTKFVTALEHCDMVVAVLCGITDARRYRAVSVPWATSGCGTRRWAAFRPKSSLSRSIRCWLVCVSCLMVRIARPMPLPARCALRGPSDWD